MPIDLVSAACLNGASGTPLSPRRVRALVTRASLVTVPAVMRNFSPFLATGRPRSASGAPPSVLELRLPRDGPDWTRPREFLSLAQTEGLLADR